MTPHKVSLTNITTPAHKIFQTQLLIMVYIIESLQVGPSIFCAKTRDHDLCLNVNNLLK